MLAGMIQSPSRWDPAKNPADVQQPLELRARPDGRPQGWLPAAERAQQTFPTTAARAAAGGGGVPGDDRCHIYKRAEAELRGQRASPQDQIDTEGLVVTTTIDANRQSRPWRRGQRRC